MHNYLWFIEFQTRGAPHIHILTDVKLSEIARTRQEMAEHWAQLVEPPGLLYTPVEYKPRRRKFTAKREALTTQEAVSIVHQYPNVWEILRSPDGAARYVVKYATKAEQKLVPTDYANCGRFWGTPSHLSIKKLISGTVLTSDLDVLGMADAMGRDILHWSYLPKIIFGDTSNLIQK